MDANDPRQAAIKHAIRALASGRLSEIEAFGAITSAIATPSRDKILAELARLEQEGRGPAAAMLVARKYAPDPTNLITVDSLASKLRRWRRNSDKCPRTDPESE
jgi:hypothetical protein